MLRAFLAVELSVAIREKLSTLQQTLKKTLPAINWVRPENIHLTLKFLGYVDSSHISQILAVMEPLGQEHQKFSIEVHGLGVFPQANHPRVFWVGVTGEMQTLQELVLAIDAALEPLGFPVEAKSYHPHLTLARIKRENALVGAALRKHEVLENEQHIGTLSIDRLILFQSQIDSTGPTYTPLGDVWLAGKATEG